MSERIVRESQHPTRTPSPHSRAGWLAVARIRNRKEHPQLFSRYADPKSEFRDTEILHGREYTPDEVAEVVAAAGFTVEYLFTEKIAGYESDLGFTGQDGLSDRTARRADLRPRAQA